MDFRGTHTALVTPFADDAAQSIDWAAWDALVDAQIAGGVRGLVPCGTTGESPALSDAEKIDLFTRTVKRANGKALVIAGTGSNATHHTIELSRAAEKAGVDAVMIVVPYYNKPTQEGLVAHFCAAAAAVKCPVVLYNVPARTGIDLSADAVVQICEKAKNVVAIKEATGNVLRAQELGRKLGNRLAILCGDDGLTLPMISVGAHGVISVTSNLLPREVSEATQAALDEKYEVARKLHFSLLPVHEVMFVEANPSPAKWALAERGKMKNVVRGPLVPVGGASALKIAGVLDVYARSRK
jgi:4-hydroxy-tetrahydrodipicolinate synthase